LPNNRKNPSLADSPPGQPGQPPYRLLPWLLLLVLALIWGTSFILIKKGLAVYSSDEVGALRIGIASLTLLPFALRHLRLKDPSRWKYLFLSGFLGSFIPAFLFAFAQTHLASSLAGILNSLTALFTLIIGALFFGIGITRSHMAGIFLGMAGTVLLLLPGSQGTSSNALYGLLIILATVCYGTSVNIIKSRLQGLKPLVMSSLSLLLVAPLAIGYLFTTPFTSKLAHTPGAGEALSYIALLAVFSTAVGLILFNKLVHLSSALFGSSVTYLIPVFALLWGLLDGESIRLTHLLGMLVILTGIFMVSRSK
jgi:drug/metabolite transporter (DMT)-like permease